MNLVNALLVDLVLVCVFSTWGLSAAELGVLAALLFPFIAAGLSE